MALNTTDKVRFRQWMIKTFAGPLLAILTFVVDWSIGDPRDLLHLATLGFLLFAGFPLGNIVFEEKRARLALYHGLHFLIFISPLFWLPTVAGAGWGAQWLPEMLVIDAKSPVIPPYDMIACLLAFVWAEAGLMLVMPGTSRRIEDLRLWRRSKVEEIWNSHY